MNNYLNGRADIFGKFHYYYSRSPSVRLFTSAWIAEAIALGEHHPESTTIDYFQLHFDLQNWPMREWLPPIQPAAGERQSSEPEVPLTSWVQVILRYVKCTSSRWVKCEFSGFWQLSM